MPITSSDQRQALANEDLCRGPDEEFHNDLSIWRPTPPTQGYGNRAPHTEEDMCAILQNGNAFLMNLDWQEFIGSPSNPTLKPAELFPAELYGIDSEQMMTEFFERTICKPWLVLKDNAIGYDAADTMFSLEVFREAYSLCDASRPLDDVLEDLSKASCSRGSTSRPKNSSQGESLDFSKNLSASLLEEPPSEFDLLSRSVDCPPDLEDRLSTNHYPVGVKSLKPARGTVRNSTSAESNPFNGFGIQPATAHDKGAIEKEDQCDNSDNEGSGGRPSKRPRPVGKRLNQPLACPFWKLDQTEHRKCLTFTLHNTSRVKQHLSRKHAPHFYCDRCLEVFPDRRAHERHAMSPARNCSPRSNMLNGITHHQQRQLSKKLKQTREADRWFAVWDIVFPGLPRPASPYVDAEFFGHRARFEAFARARGPAMIASELRNITQEPRSLFLAEDSVLRHAISRGLDLLLEAWSEERSSDPAQSDSILSYDGRTESDSASSSCPESMTSGTTIWTDSTALVPEKAPPQIRLSEARVWELPEHDFHLDDLIDWEAADEPTCLGLDEVED